MKELTRHLTILAASLILVSACSGGGSNSSSPEPTPEVPSITLHGVFDESFSEFPEITVSIGESHYTAEQTNNNEFTVEIEGGHSDELVTIIAQGAVSDDWSYSFKSYAGSFSELSSQAINNEVSYLNNNPGLVLNSLSASISNLAEISNNNSEITTTEDLKKHIFEVPMEDAINLAIFLKGAINEEFSDNTNFFFLEDRYSNTTDFIRDYSFSKAYVEDIIQSNQEYADELLLKILDNNYSHQQNYRLNESLETIFLTGSSGSDNLIPGVIQLKEELQNSGTANFIGIGEFTLSLDEDGDINGQIADGVSWGRFSLHNCIDIRNSNFNTRHIYSTPYSQVLEINLNSTCTSQSGEQYEYSEKRYLNTINTSYSASWESIPSHFSTKTYHPNFHQNCNCKYFSGKFSMDSENTGKEKFGPDLKEEETFSAVLTNELVINYESGQQTRYIPTSTFGNATRVIAVSTGSDGTTDIFSSFLVEEDDTPLEAPPLRVETHTSFPTPNIWAVVYSDNGTIQQEFTYPLDPFNPFSDYDWMTDERKGSWEIAADGSIVSNHYYDPNLETEENSTAAYLPSCEGQSEDCILWKKRRLRLINTDEDIYYLESYLEIFSSRLEEGQTDYKNGFIGRFKKVDI
ncbi:hypothetical protein ACJJIQ_19140 [Microbulbifer sp. ANSA003]|uniref:hypothetical protein n=1 Tax=Microbulbifer sp. ANSA003 TaxID=3243360 RepID=UPI0040427D3D